MNFMAEIRKLWEELSKLGKKISDYFDNKHDESTEGIEENADSVLEVASVASDNDEAIIELAELVGELQEEVKALKEGTV